MCVVVWEKRVVKGESFGREKRKKEKKSGDAGYRSPCPSHAKRMLYHLSYIPSSKSVRCIYINTGV